MVAADYFDGVTAQSYPVTLVLRGKNLLIANGGALSNTGRLEPLASLTVSTALGNTPRTITLADGATLVVRDAVGLSALLAQAGRADSFVSRAPTQLPLVIASIAALLGLAIAGYIWGIPWAGQKIAHALPEQVLRGISAGSLDLVKRMGFDDSKLPAAQKEEIIREFLAMKTPSDAQIPAPRIHIGSTAGQLTDTQRIHFMHAGSMGPNAFALPDGTMVITDEIVKLSRNRDQLLSVLCHELGHVVHRHGAQLVVEGGIVAAFIGLYLGDFSTVVSGAVGTLASSNYSRAAETEADDFAIAMMRANGRDPKALAAMLARMDDDYRAKKKAEDKTGKREGKGWEDYFSSHPATKERIARIEAMAQ
jgi:Zn-dependent protease with chaperone function